MSELLANVFYKKLFAHDLDGVICYRAIAGDVKSTHWSMPTGVFVHYVKWKSSSGIPDKWRIGGIASVHFDPREAITSDNIADLIADLQQAQTLIERLEVATLQPLAEDARKESVFDE